MKRQFKENSYGFSEEVLKEKILSKADIIEKKLSDTYNTDIVIDSEKIKLKQVDRGDYDVNIELSIDSIPLEQFKDEDQIKINDFRKKNRIPLKGNLKIYPITYCSLTGEGERRDLFSELKLTVFTGIYISNSDAKALSSSTTYGQSAQSNYLLGEFTINL